MATFKPWTPIDGIPTNLYFQSLNYSNGLDLIVSSSVDDGDKWLRIHFKWCFTYRFSQESARLKSLGNEIKVGNALQISTDSAYLNWYREESNGISEMYNPKHYLIICDDIVEVISEVEPVVEWISDPTLPL